MSEKSYESVRFTVNDPNTISQMKRIEGKCGQRIEDIAYSAMIEKLAEMEEGS